MAQTVLNILRQRYTTKNWTDQLVSNTDLKTILDSAHLSPSKMSMATHKIVALTHSELAQQIKDWLFWQHTWSQDGYPSYAMPENYQPTKPKDFQGQYRAPVVLFWISRLIPSERRMMPRTESDPHMVHTPDQYGQAADLFISSTCAMMAAQQLGLNTGYGVCHDPATVAKRLGFEGYYAMVALGVGYAQDTSALANTDLRVPVMDTEGRAVGFCGANVPATGSDHWDRFNRPTYEQMVTVI